MGIQAFILTVEFILSLCMLAAITQLILNSIEQPEEKSLDNVIPLIRLMPKDIVFEKTFKEAA